MSDFSATAPLKAAPPPGHWRRFRALYALLAVCIAPVVASYLAYYVFPPDGRTNYGDLVLPQRPVAGVTTTALDGGAATLTSLRGQWVMVQLAPAQCDEACRQRLWKMRQVRTTTGKDRDRVERLWLVTDAGQPAPAVLQEFDGTVVQRVMADTARAVFQPAGSESDDHIWLIDPLGNLMLRWPAQADPSRMKKDLSRVLRASRIG